MQARLDAQETAENPVSAPCSMSGVGWIVQRPVVHRSASGDVVKSPPGRLNAPTAVHVVADRQETALKPLVAAPIRFGLRWIDHAEPFHRSASVNVLPPRSKYPTPVHVLADVQDTPFKPVLVAPIGFGVGWIDHRRPFQRSTSVSVRCWLTNDPTAVHARGEVHETPSSAALVAPAGNGTAATDHTAPIFAPPSGAKIASIRITIVMRARVRMPVLLIRVAILRGAITDARRALGRCA
jgi:hypothetical protein